ncbi:ABCB8 isoform 17 [Pan troglodytes]|uniref:ATP binding cassette subfamily B member 8 n=2 Tax=Homininae TaxID=207598 RepID=F2Z3G8_HUMAN|nr:ABCB8 isoform 9 [Pan troglodytes]PNI28065.1 ABCB8 isoform 17 [Pan troglodytes]
MLVHLFRVGIRGGPFPGRLLPPLRFQTFSAVSCGEGVCVMAPQAREGR